MARAEGARSLPEGPAQLAGLDRTYVGSVERGERNVSIDNVERLAEALGIELADLFSASGPRPAVGHLGGANAATRVGLATSDPLGASPSSSLTLSTRIGRVNGR